MPGLLASLVHNVCRNEYIDNCAPLPLMPNLLSSDIASHPFWVTVQGLAVRAVNCYPYSIYPFNMFAL